MASSLLNQLGCEVTHIQRCRKESVKWRQTYRAVLLALTGLSFNTFFITSKKQFKAAEHDASFQ